MTTASRSLATALSKARVASGFLPFSYATTGDTTDIHAVLPAIREFLQPPPFLEALYSKILPRTLLRHL